MQKLIKKRTKQIGLEVIMIEILEESELVLSARIELLKKEVKKLYQLLCHQSRQWDQNKIKIDECCKL